MTRALLYCAGGGIGDSLVATIVARALRQRFAGVDALTLPGHRAALERVPDLDDVLVDDLGDERALAHALAARAYDACVVTWATSRAARVAQLAKIPVRVGQSRRLYSFRFTNRVPVRSESGDVTSHWSDILLDFARALDCDTADRIYRFVPTPQDEDEANAILSGSIAPPVQGEAIAAPVILSGASGANGVEGPPLNNSRDNFIILNPCNAIASKRGIWPIEGWAALAQALHERFGTRVLVSGSPADAPIVDAIVRRRSFDSVRSAQDDEYCARSAQSDEYCARFARSDDGGAQRDEGGGAWDDGVVSIAGRTSIGGFGALARRARAFVGITTGSMHVAAAVGCPTVGIFPFQSDFPERWAPLGRHTGVVRPSYPCHKGDTKERCRDYACVAHLDVPRILAAVESLG